MRMFGYAGNILEVDLSKRKIKTHKLNPNLAQSFLGGKGIGARLLYDRVEPGMNPLFPKNVVVIATGPFVGTPVPGACRFVVVTKSPLTNIFLDTNCGGYFAPLLRFAGYDVIIIEGCAEKPCFLYIEDGKAELHDAEHLWGLTSHETEDAIKRETNRNASVASIGPAGEKMVRFACITTDYYRNAGRGGAGAVLGSKKLKAIGVYGTKSIPVAAPEELWSRANEIRNQNPLDLLGTPVSVRIAQDTSSFPTRNYQAGVFEGAEKIS
ncbi:MAG: aldehyde ferredoxin oxidoreductase N-terminal domain-containing protein, partial [Candidatus Bathyarchaeia archaeon]